MITSWKEPKPLGCPAHAGIDRSKTWAGVISSRLPRARGDRPGGRRVNLSRLQAAPRTRGSTRIKTNDLKQYSGCPAHAGIDRKTPKS